MKYFETIAFILVVLSAIFYPMQSEYVPYVMAVGAAGLAIARFRERYDGRNLRLKRCLRLRYMAGILYLVASYLMFKANMLWVVALMIAAVHELYTMWIIRRESQKE